MQVTPYEGLRTFLDRSYASLLSGGAPPVSYSDMRDTARLIEDLVREREHPESRSA